MGQLVLPASLDYEGIAFLTHREDLAVVGPRCGGERCGPRSDAGAIDSLSGLDVIAGKDAFLG